MGILRTDKISGLEREKGQTPNLVSNGDFSDSSIAGWTGYNAVVSHDSGAGGRIKVDDSAAAGGWSNAAYVINTEPGASYRFEVRASATDSDTQYVGYYQGTYDTAGTAPTVYSSEITTTPSVHYFDLIATGSTVTIMLIANGAGVVYFDNVSFRKTDGNSIGGSVHFDGTGDYITSSALHIADSWTMEFWYNTSVNNASQRPMNFSNNLNGANYVYIELGSSGNIKARVSGAAAFGSVDAPPTNQWHHTALSYDGSTAYFALNGKLIASTAVSYSNHSIQVRFGADESNAAVNLYKGYISNARIVSGKALYTTDYTVPIHTFEVADGTNLLCFNNTDSAAASEHGLIGVSPPTLTITGNAAASTVSPGLTRDFTSGTEFQGVTTFDTQGYFVPPSGTTEQRGRGRGVWAGGYQGSVDSDSTNIIEYINISSMGNSIDFGDRTTRGHGLASFSSSTRGVFLGGRIYATSPHIAFNIIDFIQFSTTANALDFGDITSGATYIISGASNSTRGILNRGSNRDFITIASKGNTQTFGTTSFNNGNTNTGFASPTRGFCAGGATPSAINIIDYVTIQSTGNALDFGDLTFTGHCMGTSNTTRGVIFTGGFPSVSSSDICYITMASTGNAQDFGDTAQTMASHSAGSGCASATRAVRAGGYVSPGADTNAIDYVTIASTGNASDFGDLTYDRHSLSGCSDSHGGLS